MGEIGSSVTGDGCWYSSGVGGGVVGVGVQLPRIKMPRSEKAINLCIVELLSIVHPIWRCFEIYLEKALGQFRLKIGFSEFNHM